MIQKTQISPRLFLLLLLAGTLQSCMQSYVPMVANTPLLSQVGETTGGLQVANNGYGIMVSHTPVYHWGFTAGGNVFTVASDTLKALDYKHISGEVATGFYTRVSRTGRFEVYGGMGQSSSGDGFERWHMRRFFLQPSIGVSAPLFDACITPRFSYVNHLKTTEGETATYFDNDAVLFFEPSVTIRAGYESFKFSLQAGLALPMSNQGSELSKNYQSTLLAFGIHLCFGKDFDRYE